MFTRKWYSMRLVVMTLALLGAMALPARGEVVSGGPKVGQWKTWVLAAGTEIQVPAPPAETSDQTKAELAELRQLQKERSPITNTAIQYYNAVPATQRWHDLAHTLARAEKQSLNRQARLATILHTALHDAVIATWSCEVPVQPQATQPAGAGRDPSGPGHGRNPGAGAVVSVRARGARRDRGRHPDRVLPQGGGQPEGHGRGGGADAAADGGQLPQRHRCRVHSRSGGGTEGARPRCHRRLRREVDWHGADRARNVGREGAAGAAAGDLEAVADDAGRPVPAGAAASHRLSRVPGGTGVAEAH